MDNAQHVDFFDFLWQSGFMAKEDTERLLQGFEHYDDARERMRT
jgi:hypothetical protein